MKEIKTKLRSFLTSYIRKQDLQDDEDIFAGGFVNSLFAMQLVLFVENAFAINIDSDDLRLDNFKSIDALAYLVERKSTAALSAQAE